MAINFALLSAAAPYILDAANAVLVLINKKKKEKTLEDHVTGHEEKLDLLEQQQNELWNINEQQSKVIKDLAEQNQKLIQAGRNGRVMIAVALSVALGSLVISVLSMI